MSQNTQYTGDVTLRNGSHSGTVSVERAEDVHLHPGAVDGDLCVINAEYVYMAGGDEGNIDRSDTDETISGTIEDVYVEEQGVEGTLIIDHPGDVFIAPDAVSGTIDLVSPEDVFSRVSRSSELRETVHAATPKIVSGWQKSRTISNDPGLVFIDGWDNSVTIDNLRTPATVIVQGGKHTVEIKAENESANAKVSLNFVGYDNQVSLGPFVDRVEEDEAGKDNTVGEGEYPAERLIQRSREEAYDAAGTGVSQVTYQTVSDSDDGWCEGCGSNADAVIERHREKAFFLFGHRLFTKEKGNTTYQCENCLAPTIDEADLSEEERRNIYS